jgi:hypothetical protein
MLIRSRTDKRTSPRVTRRGGGNWPTRNDTHPPTRKTNHEIVFHKLMPH